MNAEKYERGHGKAKVLGIISIVLGAFTILGHLEVSLVGLLGIVLGGLIIYHALKFMKQSENHAARWHGSMCGILLIAYVEL